MNKLFTRKACLKYIIECSEYKQYYLAQKIFVTTQQFTKYYQGIKPIREDAIPILEQLLEIDRTYWLDNRRRCLMLTEELKIKIDEFYLNKHKERFVNFSNAEEAFYADANVRMLIAEFSENLLSYYTSAEGESAYSQVVYEVDFYKQLFKLRKNPNITHTMWSSIIDALNIFLLPNQERTDAKKKGAELTSSIANAVESLQSHEAIEEIVKSLDVQKANEQEEIALYEALWEK